jgi:hypothetical protein
VRPSPRDRSFASLAVALLLAGSIPASLAAGSDALAAPLVPRGAVWRFLDNGSNPGTSWTGISFNDAAWSSGPARLGYGGDGEVTTVNFGGNPGAKYITTYFRQAFEIADPDVFRSLKLRVVRDDGVRVFLNAVEVFRSNLPAGNIGFATNASSALSGGDEFIAVETNLSPALLRRGLNVVAAEVHQSSGGSSDLGFDLALDGDYADPLQPLRLNAARVTNWVAVAWPQLAVGHVLQSAPRLPPTNRWNTVANPITFSGTNQRVVLSGVSNQFLRLRRAPVDASTLSNKLMFGYQAWFACTNDGSPPNRWVHWFRSQTPVATNATVDFWPDIAELDADELFATGMTLPGGAPAKLYGAYKHKTVRRHFRWMHDYGIDGVFLQRFSSELGDPSFADWRNQAAYNCRVGAEAYGRVFAIMYDISGQNSNTLVATLTNDWTQLSGPMGLTNSAAYLRHRGKPVVALWGFGFTDRPGTAADAQLVIDWFKAAGCTVMGGLPTNWRALSGDSKTDPAWAAVYRAFDILSPWSVGRYSSNTGADTFRQNYIVPDLAEARRNGRDYLPVIWPGFSWRNLNAGPLNQIPRNGGRFWWRQLYNAQSAGCSMIYGAMFDEVDEGTAMFKLAPTTAELPAQGTFVPLNIDGETLPSDWYLRLAGEGARMLRGEIPLTATRPINP